MNHLLVGTNDKTARLLDTQPGFLLIDDGPIADAFLAQFKAREFNPTVHSFNPLKGMTVVKARAFAAALWPEKDLMTYDRGKRALVRMLLANPTRLDRLKPIPHSGTEEALERIDDLLLSPLLRRVFCGPKQFSFNGSVVARIDRSELGDDDAFILASLLIGQVSKGQQVIVPDFGFYGRPLHLSLIRQNRLTCGVNFLSELEPKMQQSVLLIKDKRGSGCTHKDAVVLAEDAHLYPTHNNYNDFIQEVMSAPGSAN